MSEVNIHTSAVSAGAPSNAPDKENGSSDGNQTLGHALAGAKMKRYSTEATPDMIAKPGAPNTHLDPKRSNSFSLHPDANASGHMDRIEEGTIEDADGSLSPSTSIKGHLAKDRSNLRSDVTDAVARALGPSTSQSFMMSGSDNNTGESNSQDNDKPAAGVTLRRSPLVSSSSHPRNPTGNEIDSSVNDQRRKRMIGRTVSDHTVVTGASTRDTAEPSLFSELMNGKAKGIKRYSTDELKSFKHIVMQQNIDSLTRPHQGTHGDSPQEMDNKTFNLEVQNLSRALAKKQVAFAVDETVCGLVIGKGGVNVKKLEKTFDVEIIVNAKKNENATKRIVTIIGTSEQMIEKARQALDYQQVFIPILGFFQKKLVARASEDKFQKWRTETGCVRIEFEQNLEDYDPATHRGGPGSLNGQGGFNGPRGSNREIIRQKKEEYNDLHNGFLRLVGTRESISHGQKYVENELDRANKMAIFEKNAAMALNTREPDQRDDDIRVHHTENNYSRVAAGGGRQGLQNFVGKQFGYQSNGTNAYVQNTQGNKPNGSAIYQLWQEQQGPYTKQPQMAHPINSNYYSPQMQLPPQQQQNFGPVGYNPYTPVQTQSFGNNQGSHMSANMGYPKHGWPGNNGQHRNSSVHRYSTTQKNLDDMLLEGKLSVDEYAVKLSQQSHIRQ